MSTHLATASGTALGQGTQRRALAGLALWDIEGRGETIHYAPSRTGRPAVLHAWAAQERHSHHQVGGWGSPEKGAFEPSPEVGGESGWHRDKCPRQRPCPGTWRSKEHSQDRVGREDRVSVCMRVRSVWPDRSALLAKQTRGRAQHPGAETWGDSRHPLDGQQRAGGGVQLRQEAGREGRESPAQCAPSKAPCHSRGQAPRSRAQVCSEECILEPERGGQDKD